MSLQRPRAAGIAACLASMLLLSNPARAQIADALDPGALDPGAQISRARASAPVSDQASEGRGFDGCAVMDGGRAVAEENADRLFVPASVLKIITTAAAMHYLGPDYQAQTRIVADGSMQKGILTGDLIWIGGGDPTWNQRFFEQNPRTPILQLIQRLTARGLVRVTGDLVIDTSRFPGRSFPAARAINEIAFGFAAPTSAIAVDEGAMAFRIGPGKKVGAPGIAHPQNPEAMPPSFRWINHTMTVPKERDGRGTVDFQPIWDSLTLNLRGEYPISEPPYLMSLAVPDGNLYAGELILKHLRAAGIQIDGELVLRDHSLKNHRSRSQGGVSTQLAIFKSPPLSQWLPPILQESLNWYAEMLLRQLALTQTGEGRSDSGLDSLGTFLVDVIGAAPDSFHLDDASGVSPYNLISPRTVAQVLSWARGQPWGDIWVRSFPRSKTGTLKAWPELPAQAVAKTGTLRHTLALAGYARPEGKSPIAFACFLGHRTAPRPKLRRELVAKARALISPP